MFTDKLIHDIVTAAAEAKIDAPPLLALVEVETGGVTFEADGRTPALRYEPHVCFTEASRVSKQVLARFVAAGLASPGWNVRADSQIQRTSAQRLALLSKARAIDEEVALSSFSMGIGQVMGENAKACGFESSVHMFEYMCDGGIAAQLQVMIEFLRHTGLIQALNARQFSKVARGWNGPRYAENQYDVRLQKATERWEKKLVAPQPAELPPEAALTEAEIRTVQQELRAKGYFEVGEPDGKWSSRTIAGISALQFNEGLPPTGHYDEATRQALANAGPREVAPERERTTPRDLKEQGSRTIEAADKLSWFGRATKWICGALGIGGVGEQTGLLDQAQEFEGKVSQVRELWNSFHGLLQPLLTPQMMVLCVGGLVVGIAVHKIAGRIAAYRTEDHRNGVHAGPGA